jgi:ParB/RepB/Spo0J family partition protein
MDSQRLDLDLHRLKLRFAASRLVEPRAVARIAHSIERCGQIVPCIVVAVPGGAGGELEQLVLIDGYRRIAALRRLGRDTASVERWTCDVTDALLGLLARTQNRPFASIEEALLIRELLQEQGLSQHDVARRCGRDVSWVSRRLQLLSGLPMRP